MQPNEPQVNYCIEGTHDRIREEVRDDIRARLEGPVRALHRWDCGRPASEFNEPLAEIVRTLAISSSSATETCSFEACDLPSGHPGDHAFTPHIPGFRSSATHEHDVEGETIEAPGTALSCSWCSPSSATETQDGERPGLREAAQAVVDATAAWHLPTTVGGRRLSDALAALRTALGRIER